MTEFAPQDNGNKEIDPLVKNAITHQFGEVEEFDEDYVFGSNKLELRDYSSEEGHFSLVGTNQDPPTVFIDYLLTDPEKKSRVKRDIKYNEEKEGLHHASIIYKNGNLQRDYFFSVDSSRYDPSDRRFGIDYSYIPPKNSEEEFDYFNRSELRSFINIGYDEGIRSLEGEPTVELEMPLVEMDEVEDVSGRYYAEDRSVTLTFLQKHGLVRMKYPNPEYIKADKLGIEETFDIKRTFSKRFKEGEVITLDPSIPYKFKVTHVGANIRVVRVNSEKNTSWELEFPQHIDFDKVESQIQAERGKWDKIDDTVSVSFATHDANLLIDDPTYHTEPDEEVSVPEKFADDDLSFKQAMTEKMLRDAPSHLKKEGLDIDALLPPPAELNKRIREIANSLEQMEEEEYGHLTEEERARLRKEQHEKRMAAFHERSRQEIERGIKAQEYAESYPIYEVFVTEGKMADPFDRSHIFYQAAKEFGYDIKIVPLAPDTDNRTRPRSKRASERLIVMAPTEDMRNKLNELYKLIWKHNRYVQFEDIERGDPRSFLGQMKKNKSGPRDEDSWTPTYREGTPIKDLNLLRRCFMRAELRRRERSAQAKKDGYESTTEHLFVEASAMYDRLFKRVKPIEQEELVKNFIPALQELLISHPHLAPDASPLQQED